MQATLLAAAGGLASYLLGSVPFGLLVARAKGLDVRKLGSGNIGATNVFRTVGKPYGILTFVCDALKGFLAAFAFPRLVHAAAPQLDVHTLGVVYALLAVAGHNWPVTLRFKGGKGIATSAGALVGIAWIAAVAGLAVWVAVFLATGYVSAASILSAVAVACAAWISRFWLADSGLLVPAALTLLAAAAVWRHKQNIQRLLAGTEHRFQRGRKRPEPGSGQYEA